MKIACAFLANTLVGVLVVLPSYLAVLVLLKGMQSVAGLVRPFATLLPEWLPAEKFLSLVLKDATLQICRRMDVEGRVGEEASQNCGIASTDGLDRFDVARRLIAVAQD
jgi:hypothetical protein